MSFRNFMQEKNNGESDASPPIIRDWMDAPLPETIKYVPNMYLERFVNWVGPEPLFEFSDKTFVYPQSGASGTAYELFNRYVRQEITLEAVMYYLRPQYDINGQLISGATWFDSFNKQREKNLRGGTGDSISADAIASMVADLSDTANQLGVEIEDAMLVDIATLALRRKYNDAQIVDQLFSKIDVGNVDSGDIDSFRNKISALATSHFVTLSESKLNDLTRKYFVGEITEDGITNLIQKQSIASNPLFEPYINKGLSPMDALDYQRQNIADALEVDIDSIDLSQDKYRNIVMRPDDMGNMRFATSTEIQRSVRNLEEWQGTQQARDETSNMTGFIAQVMGIPLV